MLIEWNLEQSFPVKDDVTFPRIHILSISTLCHELTMNFMLCTVCIKLCSC